MTWTVPQVSRAINIWIIYIKLDLINEDSYTSQSILKIRLDKARYFIQFELI